MITKEQLSQKAETEIRTIYGDLVSYTDKIRYIVSSHLSNPKMSTDQSLNEEAFFVLHKLRKEASEMIK